MSDSVALPTSPPTVDLPLRDGRADEVDVALRACSEPRQIGRHR